MPTGALTADGRGRVLAEGTVMPLLGQRVTLSQPGSLQQRVRAVEERGHQRREFDDPGAGLGRGSAGPELEPSRDPGRLR